MVIRKIGDGEACIDPSQQKIYRSCVEAAINRDNKADKRRDKPSTQMDKSVKPVVFTVSCPDGGSWCKSILSS